MGAYTILLEIDLHSLDQGFHGSYLNVTLAALLLLYRSVLETSFTDCHPQRHT
jgi:hypothetical protein